MSGEIEAAPSFDLGLAKRGLVPNALALLGAGGSILIGLLLKHERPCIPLLSAGVVMTLSFAIVRRIGGTRVVLTQTQLLVYTSGRLERPRVVPYDQIRTVEPMLGPTRVAIETTDGMITWIGPFQLWNFVRGPKKLEELAKAIRARVEAGHDHLTCG